MDIEHLPPTVSRRGLLGGALAVGAATALTSGLGAPASAAGTYDCVVVGGGLSGLAAARTLRRAGKRVVILEARNRPGGRVQNVRTRSGAYQIDGGAEFTGPTQDRIQDLADEYGVPTEPTYNDGNNIYWRNGTATTYPAAVGIPVDLGAPQLGIAVAQLSAVAATIKPGSPWEHPLAGMYDAMTYQHWIDQNATDDSARLLLALVCSATLSVRPSEISALYMFNYVASAGDESNPGTVLRLVGTSGGAQERFFDGGAARIPLAMGRELRRNTVYKAPVQSIDTRSRVAVVRSAAGTFRARRVIVAMSPAIAGRISYPHGLSAARTRLHRTVKMGSIGKFQAVYDAPFWRDQGFSGQVIGDGAPIDVTFESYSQGKHFLMGFISADKMRRLDDASPATFMDQCMGAFVRYFGPKARNLAIDRGFKRWDQDPYSWGGPTGVSSPGLLTAAGPALRDPVGPIHWAGTEAATYWQGYMDGAVSSGYRAADEVLRDLG